MKNFRFFTVAFLICLIYPAPFVDAQQQETTRFVVASLRYRGGDWNARPSAMKPLAQYLISHTSLEAASETVSLTPDSKEIFSYPFLWWSGTKDFPPFTAEERENLRRYLRYGGFVFVDDNQGSAGFGFDVAVKREIAALFPQILLQKVARDHTVFRSFYILQGDSGRVPQASSLEGLSIQGRTVLLYFHQDLGGALSRDPFGNWEFEVASEKIRKNSFQLATNLIFYALCDDYKKDALHVEYILKRRRGP